MMKKQLQLLFILCALCAFPAILVAESVQAVKKFADGHTERFAKDIAYQSHNLNDSLICGTDGDFLVVKVFDHWSNDGFYATAFKNTKSGNTILAFKGSENFATVLADIHPYGVGYKLHELYYKEVAEWAKQLPKDKKLTVVGHSLGGALAQWFTVGFTHDNIMVTKLETYNATGISSSYIDDNFKKDFCPTVIHNIQSGDLVSMAGVGFVPGTNYIYYYYGLWPLSKHSMPMLVDELPGMKRPADISHTTIESKYLNAGLFRYSQKSKNSYFDWIFHIEVAVAARMPLYLILDCLHLRGTTEVARKAVGGIPTGIIELFYKLFIGKKEEADNTKGLVASHTTSTEITLVIDVPSNGSYDLLCYKIEDDPDSERPLALTDSTQLYAIAHKSEEIKFDKLQPNTSYAFALVCYSKDQNGELNGIDDYYFLKETTLSPVGINDVTVSSASIVAYPISTDGLVTLECKENNIPASNLPLAVYNMSGMLVLSKTITEWPATVDLSHLSAGQYFIRVNGETIRVIRK